MIAVYENGVVAYREMTDEEKAEQERMNAEIPAVEPTLEEQLADLAEYVDVLTEMLMGGTDYGY